MHPKREFVTGGEVVVSVTLKKSIMIKNI